MVLRAFRVAADGDAGTYFDAGSATHRERERDFLYNHSRTANGDRQDVLVYAEGSPEWLRTKLDVVEANLVGLNETGKDRVLQSSQMSATWVIVRRSPQSIAFVNDWLSACLDEHGRLISDAPSTVNGRGVEMKGFKGHRHDQSMLSLTYKRWG